MSYSHNSMGNSTSGATSSSTSGSSTSSTSGNTTSNGVGSSSSRAVLARLTPTGAWGSSVESHADILDAIYVRAVRHRELPFDARMVIGGAMGMGGYRIPVAMGSSVESKPSVDAITAYANESKDLNSEERELLRSFAKDALANKLDDFFDIPAIHNLPVEALELFATNWEIIVKNKKVFQAMLKDNQFSTQPGIAYQDNVEKLVEFLRSFNQFQLKINELQFNLSAPRSFGRSL